MRANAMRQACKQIVIENKTENANVLIDGYFEMGTDSTSPVSYESTAETFHFNDKCNSTIETNENVDIKTGDTGKSSAEDTANKINGIMRNATGPFSKFAYISCPRGKKRKMKHKSVFKV